MSKLLSLIRRAPKRLSAIAIMIAAAIIIPTAAMAWGPNRSTFTLANPSDHVQFNSIVDSNSTELTDERNFVGIREDGAPSVWYDTMNVQPGKEYVVRMYVHNNAASSLNLTAHDVTAKFYLPTNTAKSLQVNGFVSASNVGADTHGNAGSYAEVYDDATFTNATTDFNLSYITGSLKYENNAFGPTGMPLPESIFTSTGAKLGYSQLDGNIPGCFQYSGYVSFKVKPQFATPTTNFTIQKQVRKDGDKTFVESVASKPGDKLNYRINYTNTGSATAANVILKDTLPTGVNFVPGSVKILNAQNPAGAYIANGDTLFTTGVNIGSYTGGGSNALVVYDAIVSANVPLPLCGDNILRNKASAQPEGQTPQDDTADTTVSKTCQPNECLPGVPVGDKRCVVTPPELPHTGPTENIVAVVGLGALIASIGYFVASRRALKQ